MTIPDTREIRAQYSDGEYLDAYPREACATILALCAEVERLRRMLDLRGTGPAERYWEGRWRDESAENERLRNFIVDFSETKFDRIDSRSPDPQDDLDPLTDYLAIEAWQDDARAALAQKAPIEDMNAVECTCKGNEEMCPCQNTPPAAHMVETAETPRAWRDVMDERVRQITSEGWTTEYDDVHDGAEMAHAAACYTICAAQKDGHKAPPPHAWPWDFSWWKPTDPRRDLVKAGALILAEIERLDRAALTQKGGE